MGDTGEVESFTKKWFEVCLHERSFWEVKQVTSEPVVSFPQTELRKYVKAIFHRPVELCNILFDPVDICGGFDGVFFRVTIEQGNVSDVVIDALLDTVGVISHGG